MNPEDYFAAFTNDGKKDVDGINPDTSVRLSSAELQVVASRIATWLPADAACIIGAVAGGALEDSWFDLFTSPLSAQSTCHTKMSFDTACDLLAEKSPSLALLVRAKSAAATMATEQHYSEQTKQDRAAVIETGAAAVKQVAGAAVDAVTGTFSIAPYALAAAVVVGLGVLAVLAFRKAEQA